MPRPRKLECECGNPKRFGATACDRCEELERERVGGPARRLRRHLEAVLSDEPLSTEAVAEIVGCSTRLASRVLLEEHRAGRVVRLVRGRRARSIERHHHGVTWRLP